MASQRAIDMALDLTRMPAFAASMSASPLPPDVFEVIRIAAASPQACQAAVAATGEPVPVVIEAARFYLQQVLFWSGADCYRILGIEPGASRATARSHMRCLLQWLHPDHNNNLDAIYAERVLKAWREVSGSSTSSKRPTFPHAPAALDKKKQVPASIRLPWIEYPIERPRAGIRRSYYAFVAVPTGLVIVFLVIWSAAVLYFGPDHTAAMAPLQ